MKKILSLLMLFHILHSSSLAKAEDLGKDDSTTNHTYLFARSELDVIKRETIWLELRLNERPNKPFLTLVDCIRQGVESKLITPYKNYEDCVSELPMTVEDFFINLKDPNMVSVDSEDETHSGDEVEKKHNSTVSATTLDHVPTRDEQFFSKDISTIELEVDVITNSVTCEQYLEIKMIKLIIPANKFPKGIQKEVAVFKFKEMMGYFETLSREKSWINPENKIRNMKYSDVFKNNSLWYPQTYLVATEKDRLYGYEQDPNKPLDLRKERILVGEVFMWAY